MANLVFFIIFVSVSFPVVYAAPTKTSGIQDHGDLKIIYQTSNFKLQTSKNKDHAAIATILKGSGDYDDIARRLNADFKFPQNLIVNFVDCGEANAFYDPETKQITLCYEMFKETAEQFVQPGMSVDEVMDEVTYAGMFFFYHELGHALVDLYALPVVGQEENVVDEFATVLLLSSQEDDAVLAGMDQFDLFSQEEGNLPLWDVHALDDQRYYNLACFVYGSDPKYYADIVNPDELPEERAESCPEEYEQKSRSWSRLLAGFKKKGR